MEDQLYKAVEFSALKREMGYDYIIEMDGGGSHSPYEIPQFIEKLDEGYDLVSGWRKDRQDPFLRSFISRIAKDGYYYTRLEWHKWDGTTYVVTNELYRSEMQKGGTPGSDQDILGVRWPLSDIYPYLDERTEIPVEDSLFSYWRTPVANNLDDNSPLGVSIYGNALEI